MLAFRKRIGEVVELWHPWKYKNTGRKTHQSFRRRLNICIYLALSGGYVHLYDNFIFDNKNIDVLKSFYVYSSWMVRAELLFLFVCLFLYVFYIFLNLSNRIPLWKQREEIHQMQLSDARTTELWSSFKSNDL